MIHSYVIGRGNTATAYLQAGMIRPVPGATADAVVDVQVQRTGGESRLKDERVVLFFLAEKRAERTCGGKEDGHSRLDGEETLQRPNAEGRCSAENLLGGNIIE